MSRFFGFSVFSLSAAERLALQAAMPTLEAEEQLKAGVPDAQLFDVALAAGMTADQAGDLLSARISERLKRSEQVDI